MNASRAPSCDFEQVELGTFLSNACSPKFADRRTIGLLITMPESVTLPGGGDGRLPLCVTAQLKASEVESYRHVFEPAHVVVVDDEHAETFTGPLFWKNRTFREPPLLELTPEERQIVTIKNYCSVNVLDCVNLPRRAARYHVYVTLNAHKSNVCTVAVGVR